MYYIGIDIGGTGIKAGIVDEAGNILFKDSIPTSRVADYVVLAKEIADLTKAVIDKAGVSLDDISSIGMGCPGSIDDKNGVVTYANNINLKNAPLCSEVRKHIDKDIYISNDANCAALGEFFALTDKSVTDFAAITLGTGVGGGIIINGRIFAGYNGAGAEIGHTVLVSGGESCTCGRKGCLEAYASATALIRDAERAAKANPSSHLARLIEENGGRANGKIPWDAMDMGDSVAKEVIDRYVFYVAEGVVDIINSFRPQVVAIGGGICRQGDRLLDPIKEHVARFSYGAQYVKPPKVVIAKLGNDAGIIGAAFLGRQNI